MDHKVQLPPTSEPKAEQGIPFPAGGIRDTLGVSRRDLLERHDGALPPRDSVLLKRDRLRAIAESGDPRILVKLIPRILDRRETRADEDDLFPALGHVVKNRDPQALSLVLQHLSSQEQTELLSNIGKIREPLPHEPFDRVLRNHHFSSATRILVAKIGCSEVSPCSVSLKAALEELRSTRDPLLRLALLEVAANRGHTTAVAELLQLSSGKHPTLVRMTEENPGFALNLRIEATFALSSLSHRLEVRRHLRQLATSPKKHGEVADIAVQLLALDGSNHGASLRAISRDPSRTEQARTTAVMGLPRATEVDRRENVKLLLSLPLSYSRLYFEFMDNAPSNTPPLSLDEMRLLRAVLTAEPAELALESHGSTDADLFRDGSRARVSLLRALAQNPSREISECVWDALSNSPELRASLLLHLESSPLDGTPEERREKMLSLLRSVASPEPDISLFRRYISDLEAAVVHWPTAAFRVTPEHLHELLAMANGPEVKRPATVIHPRADGNSAFAWRNTLFDELLRHRHIRFYEAKSDSDVIAALEDSAQRGPVDLIVVAGHGEQTSLILGRYKEAESIDRAELDIWDLPRLMEADVARALSPGGQILLDSCSTGSGGVVGENLANAMRTAFSSATPSAVWAATQPHRGIIPRFDADGTLLGVTFLSVEGKPEAEPLTYRAPGPLEFG